MVRIILVLVLLTRLLPPAHGQAADNLATYLGRVRDVVASESQSNALTQQLHALADKHMPSRSYVNEVFYRDVDLGFRQRRLAVSLNFYRFQVNLLCRNDTVFLRAITFEDDSQQVFEEYNQAIIAQFLQHRNQLYGVAKTTAQLLADLASPQEYAFYCGDGNPPTAEGMAIKRLVARRQTARLLAMLTSFHCETQAYGVAGLELLQQGGHRLPAAGQALVAHIKHRNSELITCHGCFGGLVEKIYSQP